ncbi:hypothetical protein [Lewinella sp. 4G2]|uniref:hypothetical protein n=1 Tax=Lewinella sp. 4G2 TaxID=1803372 RepID=UPI0007B486E5|nr:hypothetical protein [Lewinella sp. 4G2]OAV43079.1 hypothetical protein A3850_000545 [Lewinella sp. 4G2]
MIRALFLLVLFSCNGPGQSLPVDALDYTEIESPTGWRLRVYGDGGGSISHEQLPTYHLHYPCQTFPAPHLRQRPKTCASAPESTACNRATYYSALRDSSFSCACAGAGWTNELMVLAIDRMDEAVEAGGSEKSCRMLRRRWLGK